MQGLTEGRVVHYVLSEGRNEGQHRSAIVVRNWSNSDIPGSDGMVNLMVFTDGYNDGLETVFSSEQDKTITMRCIDLVVWRTSVHYSETKEPGTWHWIEAA